MQRTSSSNVALLWTILFAAVIAHLPSVGFDFVQDDFSHLARGAGLDGSEGWSIRPWSTWWIWIAQWTWFGSDPSFLHGLSVVLAGSIGWWIARLGLRLGLRPEGAGIAALVFCLSVTTDLATAWASASAELWAVLFALVAIELWIDPRGGNRALGAALAAILSLLSKESALALFVLLPLAQRWFAPGELSSRDRRGRRLLLAVLAVVSVVTAGLVVRHFHFAAGTSAYALATPVGIAKNLLLHVGWSAAPTGFGTASDAVLGLGVLALLIVGGAALVARRTQDRLPFFAILLSGAGLAPAILLASHHYAYYSLIGTVGWAWILGGLLGPPLAAWRRSPRVPQWTGGVLLVLLLVVGGLGGAWMRHGSLWTRDDQGRLVEPILDRSLEVPRLRRTLGAYIERGRPEAIVVLQATRVDIPESVAERAEEVIVRSPAFVTLDGTRGLRLLGDPDLPARWTSTLDQTPINALVLLDAGGPRLAPLGPPENARLYAGLIAIAAEQYDRARHELWWVINLQGAEVSFAFDPDHLPISPAELDATAPGFASFLAQDPAPSSQRVLRLFEQMYEAVRGQPLPTRSIGPTLRAPRM